MSQLNWRLAHPESLKPLGLACGMVLVLSFFLPYAAEGRSAVMAWDLALESGRPTFMLLYPLLAGVALITLFYVGTLPFLARALVTVSAGLLPVLVFAVQREEVVHLAARDTPISLPLVLGLPALAAGLIHRVVCPRSTAARILVGLGLALALAYFVMPLPAGKLTITRLLSLLGSTRKEEVVSAALLLLMLPLLLGAVLALPRTDPHRPAVEKGVAGLSWFFLCFLPGLLALVALTVLVDRPDARVFGIFKSAAVAAAYLALLAFGASHALRLVDDPEQDDGQAAPAAPTTGDVPPRAGAACATCGLSLEPGAKFCDSCGAATGSGGPRRVAITAPSGLAVPPPPELIIGREITCGLVLPDSMEGASRQHARVFVEDGTITIQDLGSANGTYLNGERITRSPMKPSDRVRFGRTAQEMSARELLKKMGLG